MEENLVLLCAQVNRLDGNVGKDIKVPVLESVHRNSSTNQSCAQRSQNPCNFEKVYYFVFKFWVSLHKFSIVLWLSYWREIFCLFEDSANKNKEKEYKVYLILETVWTSWYSALLCNIYKCNHLVIIVGEFIWDNCFQIMFVINILTLQSLLLYHFYTFIPYITRTRLLRSHWSSPQVWSLTFHKSQLL